MTEPPRRCLVLGGREALREIDEAIDLALEFLGLERAPAPSPEDDLVAALHEVDVVVGEVSKPSPSISFELGIATAIGLPTLFIADTGTRGAPVFRPVWTYDSWMPTKQLAFNLATAMRTILDLQPPEAPTQPADEPPATADYVQGEAFEGPVLHVDQGGGYVLVGYAGRRPAMLHVSNMTAANAAAFEGGRIEPGDTMLVEVGVVDEDRDRVLLVDHGVRRPLTDRPADDRGAATELLGHSYALEDALARLEEEQPKVRARFAAAYGSTLRLVRSARNKVTHGEFVLPEELDEAISAAIWLRQKVRDAPPP
jgi:hypothetical protein